MLRLGLMSSLAFFVVAGEADASCVCRCMDGQMQPICDSTIDVAPICPMTLCEIAPPSIAPIPPTQMPSLGTTECSQRQVLNPATRRYEWRTICE